MEFTPRLRTLTLFVALGLVAIGLTVALSPAQAMGAGKDPDFNRPAVGECRSYSYSALQKRTNSSAPVPCTGPHTSMTIAVPRIKGKVDSRSIGTAYVSCLKAARKTVGAALPLTAYRVGYFVPSKAEAKRGAKWVRCDLVLYAGRNLATIPTPLVSSPVPDAVGVCAVTVKGKTILTTCAGDHDFRLSGAFKARGSRYPGAAKLLRTSIVTCAKKVSTPTRFWSFYPTAAEWRAGFRTVTCLTRTKS